MNDPIIQKIERVQKAHEQLKAKRSELIGELRAATETLQKLGLTKENAKQKLQKLKIELEQLKDEINLNTNAFLEKYERFNNKSKE